MRALRRPLILLAKVARSNPAVERPRKLESYLCVPESSRTRVLLFPSEKGHGAEINLATTGATCDNLSVGCFGRKHVEKILSSRRQIRRSGALLAIIDTPRDF